MSDGSARLLVVQLGIKATAAAHRRLLEFFCSKPTGRGDSAPARLGLASTMGNDHASLGVYKSEPGYQYARRVITRVWSSEPWILF